AIALCDGFDLRPCRPRPIRRWHNAADGLDVAGKFRRPDRRRVGRQRRRGNYEEHCRFHAVYHLMPEPREITSTQLMREFRLPALEHVVCTEKDSTSLAWWNK